MNQRTIARAVECSGRGLHTGATVRLRLLPAAAGSGFAFVRTDLPGRPRIVATAANRIAQPRRTAIEHAGAEVHTVEHLVSAAVGLGIDALEVEVDGPEVPGFDGSALRWIEYLRGAGTVELPAPRVEVVVREPVQVLGANDSSLTALPCEQGFKVTYQLDYPGTPILENQVVDFELAPDRYVEEIAPARTFVLRSEAELLKAMGMGAGASFDNTVVYEGHGTVHDVPLRFPDEAARHKILDLVGDLALLGAPLRAHVLAVKSGHELNLELVKALLLRAP